MKYFTYIILCSNSQYYIGHTNNLSERLNRHIFKQGAKFTTHNKPIRIVWHQEFDNELDAMKRERQIKGWTKAKKEKLIKGTWK